MTGQILVAAALVLAAARAAVTLPAFHPVTLTLVPWAATMTLFCMRLLPYAPLSGATLYLITAGLGAFSAGALVAGRRAHRIAERRRWYSPSRPVLETASALASACALGFLLAFLVQIASRFGVRPALVADPDVRANLAIGTASLTIKYIYFAFAGATLAGVCAARARGGRQAVWLAVGLLDVAMEYFSTGRSNVLLAALMLVAGFGMTTTVRRRVLLATLGGVGLAALISFVAVGSLLGKTLANSDILTYENTFVEHPALQPVALAYQYLTAPIGALNTVVAITPTWGRSYGCATLAVGCLALNRAGLPVRTEPKLTAFTQPPSRWNTFSALYSPLADVGPGLTPLVMMLLGALYGTLWRLARRSTFALLLYVPVAAGLVYSVVENTLLESHLVGAGVVASVALAIAATLRRYASLTPRHLRAGRA